MEHDYFGVIEETAAGGLRWSDAIEVSEQYVELELSAPASDGVSARALDAAASLLTNLDRFDARARDALVAQLSDRASVTAQYVERSSDALGESLLDLLVDNSGDLAVDVLRSLQLLRVRVHPENADDDAEFAVFDYSISPDDTDALLTVSFDLRGDVVAVETDEVADDDGSQARW